MKFISFCRPALAALNVFLSFLFALLLPISDTLLVPHLPLFMLGNISGFMCSFSWELSKSNYAPLTPLCIITNSHL